MEQIRRWTTGFGGPWGLAVVLALQTALAVLFALSPLAAVAVIGATMSVLVVLQYPLLGVGLLIAARLLSTGATVFFRIGRMGIGPFEPALILCAGALVVQAAVRHRGLALSWPWRTPFLALFGWAGLSLLWCVSKSDAIGDLIPMVLILANTLVILTFVRTWTDFHWMARAWFFGTIAIGVISVLLDMAGIQVGTVTFKAAAGGGRETGLGQQPNWYAMNLMFAVLPGVALSLIERLPLRRMAYALGTLFILFMMLKSGSRGGAYALIIGVFAISLFQADLRRWFVRFGGVAGLLVGIGLAFDFGGSAKALARIGSNYAIEQNYRPLNWQVCVEMFLNTWGRGIGAGGYEDLLPEYNNYLAESLYDYPHGIFWDVLAHYGAVGLGIVAALVWIVGRMTVDLIRWTRGTVAEVFAWTMPATILAYGAWSWVEFTIDEKPFWEFLALYTALYLMVQAGQKQGLTLPAWDGFGKGRAPAPPRAGG